MLCFCISQNTQYHDHILGDATVNYVNILMYPSTTTFNQCIYNGPMALSYYSDLMLSQAFQPMVAQLSKKAALPLAKIVATASCWCSNTGPRNTLFYFIVLMPLMFMEVSPLYPSQLAK